MKFVGNARISVIPSIGDKVSRLEILLKVTLHKFGVTTQEAKRIFEFLGDARVARTNSLSKTNSSRLNSDGGRIKEFRAPRSRSHVSV